MLGNQTGDSQHKAPRNWPRQQVTGRALIIWVVSHLTWKEWAYKLSLKISLQFDQTKTKQGAGVVEKYPKHQRSRTQRSHQRREYKPRSQPPSSWWKLDLQSLFKNVLVISSSAPRWGQQTSKKESQKMLRKASTRPSQFSTISKQTKRGLGSKLLKSTTQAIRPMSKQTEV